MKWTDGKQVIWVNADGVGGEAATASRMPVAGRVTSSFGNRFHPILGYARFHDGRRPRRGRGHADRRRRRRPRGRLGLAGGYGREVVIAHEGGIETRYGHMSRIAA